MTNMTNDEKIDLYRYLICIIDVRRESIVNEKKLAIEYKQWSNVASYSEIETGIELAQRTIWNELKELER